MNHTPATPPRPFPPHAEPMPVTGITAPVLTRDRLDRFAVWVSRVASPPCLGILAVLLAAGGLPGAEPAWTWAAGYVGLVVAAPAGYVAAQHRRGAISDLDLSNRHERVRPYAVTVAALCLASVLLHAGSAPAPLVLLGDATTLVMIALGAVTLRWKISAHAAVAAMLAVFVAALRPSLAPLGVPVVPLVCWARIHLGRHDLAQTVAGSAVGAGVVALLLAW